MCKGHLCCTAGVLSRFLILMTKPRRESEPLWNGNSLTTSINRAQIYPPVTEELVFTEWSQAGPPLWDAR